MREPVKPFMHSGVCIIGSLAIFKRVWEGRAAIVDAHAAEMFVRSVPLLHARLKMLSVRNSIPLLCKRVRRESNRMNNILRIHHMAGPSRTSMRTAPRSANRRQR